MLVQPLMFYLFQWKMTVKAGVKAWGQHNLSSSSLRDLGHNAVAASNGLAHLELFHEPV